MLPLNLISTSNNILSYKKKSRSVRVTTVHTLPVMAMKKEKKLKLFCSCWETYGYKPQTGNNSTEKSVSSFLKAVNELKPAEWQSWDMCLVHKFLFEM